jgi:hypothetical protein
MQRTLAPIARPPFPVGCDKAGRRAGFGCGNPAWQPDCRWERQREHTEPALERAVVSFSRRHGHRAGTLQRGACRAAQAASVIARGDDSMTPRRQGEFSKALPTQDRFYGSSTH